MPKQLYCFFVYPVKCRLAAIPLKAELFNRVNADYFTYAEKKAALEKPEKIYSQRKSSDSPGGFGFDKTRRTNQTII